MPPDFFCKLTICPVPILLDGACDWTFLTATSRPTVSFISATLVIFVKLFLWAMQKSYIEGKTTNGSHHTRSSWTPCGTTESRTLDRLAALLKNRDKFHTSLVAFSSYVWTPSDSCGFSNQSLRSTDNSIGGADRSVGDNYRGTCQVQVERRFQIRKHTDGADTLYLNSYSNCREFPAYSKERHIHFFFFFWKLRHKGVKIIIFFPLLSS